MKATWFGHSAFRLESALKRFLPRVGIAIPGHDATFGLLPGHAFTL